MHSEKKGELMVELGGVFYLLFFLHGAMDKRRKGKLFHIGTENHYYNLLLEV